MHDRNVSLGFALSIFVWFVGATLVVIGVALPHDHFGSDLGHLGIVVCCGGAVLMIRAMMCRSVKHLEDRFNHAYQLGRDVGRVEAGVPLQRIH